MAASVPVKKHAFAQFLVLRMALALFTFFAVYGMGHFLFNNADWFFSQVANVLPPPLNQSLLVAYGISALGFFVTINLIIFGASRKHHV